MDILKTFLVNLKVLKALKAFSQKHNIFALEKTFIIIFKSIALNIVINC